MKMILLFMSMCLFTGPVSAEIYKWTDENGNINYGDSKPKNQEVTEIEFPVSTYYS